MLDAWHSVDPRSIIQASSRLDGKRQAWSVMQAGAKHAPNLNRACAVRDRPTPLAESRPRRTYVEPIVSTYLPGPEATRTRNCRGSSRGKCLDLPGVDALADILVWGMGEDPLTRLAPRGKCPYPPEQTDIACWRRDEGKSWRQKTQELGIAHTTAKRYTLFGMQNREVR